MRKNKIFIGVLITFIILSCLSAVSAQDLSDDLSIQESSSADLSNQDLSISESAVNNNDNYQSELVEDIDNNQDYQENLQESDYAEEILKSSESNSSKSILGGDCSEQEVLGEADSCQEVLGESNSGQESLGDGMDDQNPIIIVDIDPDPSIIQVIVYTGDSYYVEGNTFADIQNAISRANHGDAIILNPGTTYIGDGSSIIVNKDLTFAVHGANAVLDARNLSRIMDVARDCQVSISNVDFINGNATGDKHSGGAIVWGGPNGILKNCNFYNNHAESHAGAILWGQNDATIENCNFINNSAPKCGNLVIFGYRDTVKNCNFYNNSCRSGGAIYIFYDGVRITDCNFEDNSATYGGAIESFGVNNTISNCNFVNNVGMYGGAIYSDCTGLSVSGSRFSGGSAKYGGAICIPANDNCIMSCNFTNNNANDANGIGGAIFINGINDTVSNCIFINNTATVYGGAIITVGVEIEIDGGIYNVSKGLITGSSFVDNFAGTGKALLFANAKYPYVSDVTDCTFKYKADSTALNANDENFCLTFTLESSLDYSETVYGLSEWSDLHFWKGGSFTTTSYYMPYFSTIKGADQNIILEIYNSTNKLVANISSSTDSSGQISYDYRSLPDGQYTYKVYHPDNDDFSFIQNQGSFERYHTPTSVSISVTNVTYPNTAVATITASSPGTYKIIIAGTSYGDIVFTEDEIANGNGKASKNVNVDLLGASDSYAASVTYERTDNYDSASNQTTFKVLKAGSSIDVSDSAIYYGSDAVLNYHVENGSLSMVSIKKGSNALQNGVDYSFTVDDNAVTISGLAEGVYTVSFTTVVDNNHAASSKEVTVTVNPLVDLSVVASVNNQTPLYGDTVVYTITVTNNGPSTATDVVVSDTIPEGMNVSSSDANYIGNGVWNISSIGVGSENAVTLTLYATVNTLETLSNEINVSSKEEENNGLDNKAIAPSLCPLPIVNMTVAMSPSYDVQTLRIGDNLVYTITISNNGPFDATDVIVVDEFDTNLLSLVSATLDGETIDFINNCTIDSIPNGNSRIIVLTFEVINNGTIVNNVSVGSSEFETDESDNIVSDDSVYANPLVDLSISISADKEVLIIGDTVAYTITVTNNGPSNATDVVVSDTIPEGMNVSSSDANYIGNGVWNISSIGVGSENAVTLTLYATVNTLETLSNEINVSSKEEENNGLDNKAIAPSLCPLPIVNMTVAMSPSYDVQTLRIGDNLVYTITISNNGPFDATDVIVVDEFDTNLLSLVSATLDGETIDFINNCTIDSIPNGNSRIIVLTFEVINNGTIVNNVSVGSSEFETDESDNIVSDDSVYANPLVDLSISISADKEVLIIGDTVAYTITVTNNGPSNATDVVVSDTIPEGMNVSSSDANYIGNGVWNISSIGVGSENAVTLTLYATANALGSLSNEINVISNEYDSNVANNKADLTVNAIPVYNLKINSVATASSVKIGDSFNFTVTVINEGPYDASDVKVTEKLSSLVKLVSAKVSVGTYDSSTNLWNIGDLGANSSASLVLTVQAISQGPIQNRVSVSSSAYDLNEEDNTFFAENIKSNQIATKIVYTGMTTTAIDAAVDGKKGQYFSIILKDSSNKVLANKTVRIIFGNVVYKVTTDSKGVAKVQVNLKSAGTYHVSIRFLRDSKYLQSSASTKIIVKEQKPKLSSSKKTFKAKAKTKKVTAKLKTSRGKVLKNQKIVFTIKGKKYTAKTNKKGIATVKIKLTKKGKFTCKIKFAGDRTYSAISKKIKVIIK